MDQLLKYLLPAYLLLFFGLAFFWRSYLVWKRLGVNPYALGGGDTAHDFIGKLFRLTLVAAAGIVAAYSLSEFAYSLLVPIPWLQSNGLVIAGLVLMTLALVWVLVAQSQMGDSWRIGIDSSHKTELVQSGVFAISRNPIFLGMKIMLIGLLLTLPTAASLAVLVLGLTLIDIQVRLEEEYLLRTHGEAYTDYLRKVRRWL